jgi:hypothetical protein
MADEIYQHPLAYLIGVEGVALLRCFAGEHEVATTARRLAEVAHLLTVGAALGPPASTGPVDAVERYNLWARSYDEPGNQLVDIEGPIVRAFSTTCRRGWLWTRPARRGAGCAAAGSAPPRSLPRPAGSGPRT